MNQLDLVKSAIPIQNSSIQSDAIQIKESTYSSGVYGKRPVSIVRGSGAHLWDVEGNEYIDCVGGQGSSNIGHAVPEIAEAIYKQAQVLIGCPEMFYNDRRAELEERLCLLTGMSSVFLSNSGTEAVEAAIKFSRILTGRTEILAAMRGFHGRSMGSLSATWEKKYRVPFEPLVPGFSHFPYNDLSALKEKISTQTAAVILEVVQGEGGVNPGTQEFLTGAQEICRANGALLILDEVQTGFGRTGRMFAHQHFSLQPDLLCLAKSIAGGIPMGATLMSPSLASIPSQVHGSTFGGNPLACASSIASLDFIENYELVKRSAELGAWFLAKLQEIPSPLIREVRGMGLMIGIELKQKVTPYLQKLMSQGVMALPAGMTVMRFLPPLVIEKSDLEIVVEKVSKILTNPNTETF